MTEELFGKKEREIIEVLETYTLDYEAKVRNLFLNGADPNAFIDDGEPQTLLGEVFDSAASDVSLKRVVEIFKEFGFDPRRKNGMIGAVALWNLPYAFGHFNSDMMDAAKCLLDMGADPSIPSVDWDSGLDTVKGRAEGELTSHCDSYGFTTMMTLQHIYENAIQGLPYARIDHYKQCKGRRILGFYELPIHGEDAASFALVLEEMTLFFRDYGDAFLDTDLWERSRNNYRSLSEEYSSLIGKRIERSTLDFFGTDSRGYEVNDRSFELVLEGDLKLRLEYLLVRGEQMRRRITLNPYIEAPSRIEEGWKCPNGISIVRMDHGWWAQIPRKRRSTMVFKRSVEALPRYDTLRLARPMTSRHLKSLEEHIRHVSWIDDSERLLPLDWNRHGKDD